MEDFVECGRKCQESVRSTQEFQRGYPTNNSKWCSNSSQPDLATLDKIATLLNVDRRELIAPSK